MLAAWRTPGRILSAALAALAVVITGAIAAFVAPGCNSQPGYPATLEFPPRTDRLVLRLPASQPSGLGEPGKLEDELAALDALGGETFDPANAPAERRMAIDQFLVETFGTPAEPSVKAESTVLALASDRLEEASRLYRRHCLQCHGLTGDGRGPTGQWIYPHPCDFRRGSFKFVSTGDGGKPRRRDLKRTLQEGLKGTSMPSFALLPENQRDLLAAYVVYLSLRGQSEFLTLATVYLNDESDPAAYAKERLELIVRDWEKAEKLGIPIPRPSPDDALKQSPEHLAAVRRGYELFTASGGRQPPDSSSIRGLTPPARLSGITDCASCHENFGRKETFRYDVWGTVVRPRDLTTNAYKGGDRPEDLFQRIRGGIQPVGMPAHSSLTDAQVWDLVWFVRALPYPRELPEDVRGKVYP